MGFQSISFPLQPPTFLLRGSIYSYVWDASFPLSRLMEYFRSITEPKRYKSNLNTWLLGKLLHIRLSMPFPLRMHRNFCACRTVLVGRPPPRTNKYMPPKQIIRERCFQPGSHATIRLIWMTEGAVIMEYLFSSLCHRAISIPWAAMQERKRMVFKEKRKHYYVYNVFIYIPSDE